MRATRTIFTLGAIVSSAAGVAANYEIEPNNGDNTAMSIAVGQPVQGNIATVSDLDLFAFESGSATSVRVLFHRPPRGFQYNLARMRILDGATELASVDAYAPDVFTTFDLGVEPNRRYLLEISGCTGSDCDDHRSELYEVLVVALPAPTFESEPNNALAQADIVQPSAWIFGQHSATSDDDLYRIVVPGPGEFFAHLSRVPDDYVYTLARIEVLDDTGALLNADDVYAPNGQGRVVLGLRQAQTIYLRVRSCPSGSRCSLVFSSPYQLVSGFRSATGCEIFSDGFEQCSVLPGSGPRED